MVTFEQKSKESFTDTLTNKIAYKGGGTKVECGSLNEKGPQSPDLCLV